MISKDEKYYGISIAIVGAGCNRHHGG